VGHREKLQGQLVITFVIVHTFHSNHAEATCTSIASYALNVLTYLGRRDNIHLTFLSSTIWLVSTSCIPI